MGLDVLRPPLGLRLGFLNGPLLDLPEPSDLPVKDGDLLPCKGHNSFVGKGPRTNCWTSKGVPPEWRQHAKEIQRKPNQGVIGTPREVGWVHRQGFIRHRDPAVGAEGLGRLKGGRPPAEGNRRRVEEALLQGQDRGGRRRDTQLLFFAGFERRPAFAALSKLPSIAKLDFQPYSFSSRFSLRNL